MVTEILVSYITNIISAIGYPGISLLMALESMIAPVPSEAVMPFAGFLVTTGRFTLPLVILASTIGSLIGSLASYYIGYYGGKPLVMRFGKYLLLEEKSLDFATGFFSNHGSLTIFFCRFIPLVRHVISIPAGIGKMNLNKFLFYTTIGATMWNTILILFGIKLGQNWASLVNYSKPLDFLVLGFIVLGIILYLLKFRMRPKVSVHTS